MENRHVQHQTPQKLEAISSQLNALDSSIKMLRQVVAKLAYYDGTRESLIARQAMAKNMWRDDPRAFEMIDYEVQVDIDGRGDLWVESSVLRSLEFEGMTYRESTISPVHERTYEWFCMAQVMAYQESRRLRGSVDG